VFENSPLAGVAVGRSTVRQRILELLIGGTATRLHLREIQRRVGTSPGTASRELARLVAAGLVDREAEGSQVYFRASDRPIAAIMRQLILAQRDDPVVPTASRVPRARRPKPAPAAIAGPPATAPPPATPAEGERAPVGEAAGTSTPINPARQPAEPPPVAPGPPPATAPPSATPDPLALVVAARFSAAIRPIYGARLAGVFLYGARASSPAPESADVELLVVLDAVERYGDELERTSAVCAELSYELGLVVSRVFVASSAWTPPASGVVPVLPAEGAAR